MELNWMLGPQSNCITYNEKSILIAQNKDITIRRSNILSNVVKDLRLRIIMSEGTGYCMTPGQISQFVTPLLKKIKYQTFKHVLLYIYIKQYQISFEYYDLIKSVGVYQFSHVRGRWADISSTSIMFLITRKQVIFNEII